MQRKPLDQAPTPTGVPSLQKSDGFPPGSVLTVFFVYPTPSRRDGRALAVASRGHLYYGIDAEIEGRVAKIAPLHRTAVGSCGSEGNPCEGSSLTRRAGSAHQRESGKRKVSDSKVSIRAGPGPKFSLENQTLC